MQAELAASQRMALVGEMAAAVAHGIGNPLSSIRAAAQVALLDAEGADGSEQNGKTRENLRSIMQQVDRVQKRMQGLLNFAKPLEPRPSRVEVNSVVREVMETMGARFSDAKVTLEPRFRCRFALRQLGRESIGTSFDGADHECA